MGVQLSSIQWYDWRSLFTLLFNLLLSGFIIYGIYIESNEKHVNVNKSIYLYEHFLQASISVFYPLCYISSIFCYFLYGHHIIMLLDSPVFIAINQNCQSNQRKFLLITIFVIIKLIWDHRYIVHHFVNIQNLKTKEIIIICSIYLFDTLQMINWYILFYHQLINYFSLRQIYGQLSTTNKSSIRKTGNNFSIEKRLFNSIKNLSVHNRHIQYYLSYLLFGILIEQTNSIIHFLTFFIVDPRRTSIGLSNIIAQTLRNCLCFFLVQLNQRNICLFDQIDRHFRSKCIANHHHHHHRDNSITKLRYSNYNQLQIYRQYHQLSVFQWLNIDSSVLVQLFFFSLSYVLIISQTTKLID